VELTYPGLNLRFVMCVVFTTNFLVGGDISVDSEALLVTDFMNLKIKSAQSFRGAHRSRMCVYAFIRMSAYTCINIYV
jgi:hypothetical protein